MAEVTLTDLKAAFAVSDIADSRLTFCLGNAITYVKSRIGFDLYKEVFLGGASTIEDGDDADSTTVNETAHRLACLKDAVLYYAMARVLVNANLRIRRAGSVKKEQDAGSPGMNNSQVINEYLTPAEVSEWRATLLSDADDLTESYIPETALAFMEMQRG